MNMKLFWLIIAGFVIVGAIGVYGAWSWSRIPDEIIKTHKTIKECYEGLIRTQKIIKECYEGIISRRK